MTFNFTLRQGLPGKCLHKSIEKCRNGAEHHFGIFYYFYKDISWKSLTKNKVKGHIY